MTTPSSSGGYVQPSNDNSGPPYVPDAESGRCGRCGQPWGLHPMTSAGSPAAFPTDCPDVPRCIRCGGTEDLMDRGMAPGMTYCGPCRRAAVAPAEPIEFCTAGSTGQLCECHDRLSELIAEGLIDG